MGLQRQKFWRGYWRLADPKISLASFASIFLGACGAAPNGPLAWNWLALTVLGIFVEVAKNASGEIFDFDSGTDLSVPDQDPSPFSGGKRVLVDGLLTRGQTTMIAAAHYAVAIAIGLSIAALREKHVFWLGVLGIACAYFYHSPPIKLAYRGLGELAVGFCYGPLIAEGTYLVQRGAFSSGVAFVSLPLGLLVAAFLWINEFPDYDADLATGKRNLVVRPGKKRAARAFAAIVVVSAALIALFPLENFPRSVWLGAGALVPATHAAKTLLNHYQTTKRLIPAQGLTLLAFVLFAFGAGLGLVLSK